MTNSKCIECFKLKQHYAKGLCVQCYHQSDKYKANKKAYNKAYRKSDKYKAYNKVYQKSDKYKAYKKAYKKAYNKNKRHAIIQNEIKRIRGE